MSLFRLTTLLLALGALSSACQCNRQNVATTLKGDGEACTADEECESSLCDKLPGKSSVCFRKCAAGCKTGDICTSLAPNDRYACVPERPGLCQPCALNVDCPYPGDKCIEIGGTKVCARDCSFDGQCPSSYRCADGTDTSGNYVTKQCQPTSGTCECTAASAGQSVPCSETNTFGTCTGVRTCRPPAGYEACTAPVPTSESCNGRDDDCNGMTDENLGETTCGTGECRRTVTNCVNGTPQLCEPLMPGTEICDNKDNDCDGVVDEGFDKMTSLTNCGGCNVVCTRPHATPVCVGGMCGIGACDPGWVNANGMDADGCELQCTPTGAEVCDGVDNNCDGRVDEGFTLASDPTNCGICGRVCNVNNGNVMTYACIASQCGIATCSTGFADCDQQYGTGCEKSVSADINNCGSCNNRCTTPNATPACVSSACAIGSCNTGYEDCDNTVSTGCEIQTSSDVNHCGNCVTVCPNRANSTRTCVSGGCGYTCNTGWSDLDQLAANGCEYSCTPSAGPDDPDDNSRDTNCDGIDGDASKAIFVSPAGNDSNPGTRTQPKLTIQSAIDAASTAKPHVYVAIDANSSGYTYTGAVTLRQGISVYGGYEPTTWSRSNANVVTIRNATASSGRIVAVSGNGLVSPASTLAYFQVRTADAPAGVSTYALHCINCPGLTVRRVDLFAGAGGAGTDGTAGVTGADGSRGGDGANGSCNSSNGQGGTAGASSCSVGGAGGDGGPEGRTTGFRGGDGAGFTTNGPGYGGPGGGGGGDCGSVCLSSCTAGGRGTNGNGGASGGNGPNGAGGNGGVVTSNFWVGANGGNGTDGTDGKGGGGGGGGGGEGGGCVDDGGGNGGGGGGGGGCKGTRGTGGTAGGGSFAMFIVNSTGLTLTDCTLTSGNGGRGGNGQGGGQGGRGGDPGIGASNCTGSVGAGGNGGIGGTGGNGGAGGGGAGGPSYPLYQVGGAATRTGTVQFFGGLGGQGGTSPVNAGTAGAAASTYP